MKVSKSDLSVVQNLYLLQVDLAEFLQSDLSNPQERRIAKERMREFSSLLRQADWRYMGGEDVLDSLKDVQEQISQKINSARIMERQSASVQKKSVAKKAVPKKIKIVAKKKAIRKPVRKTKPKTKKAALKKKKSAKR